MASPMTRHRYDVKRISHTDCGGMVVAHNARGEDRGPLDRVLVEVVATEAGEGCCEGGLDTAYLCDVLETVCVDVEDAFGDLEKQRDLDHTPSVTSSMSYVVRHLCYA